MSASREKKARRDENNLSQSPEQREKIAHKAKIRKNVLIGVAITLVVVLIIGSIVLFKGPYFRSHSVALTVGEHEITPTTVRYYYADSFSQIYQNYGSIFSQMFSSTANIQDEVYDSSTGETWGDVLMEQAVESIRTTYAIYDEAVANGYVLSEDGEAAIQNTADYLALYAQMYGKSEDAYVRTVYGNGTSKESYLEYERIKTTVSYYEQEVRNNFSYTADQLKAEYEASPSDYNVYTYHSYYVTAGTDSDEEDAKAQAKEDAQKTAESMAEESSQDLDRFLALCNENSGTEDYTDGAKSLTTEGKSSGMPDAVKEWITDTSRKEGDTTAVAYEDYGYYVLYYVSSFDNDYDALNANMIKISATTTDSSGNSTTDWDAAEEQLDKFQEEYDGYDDAETALKELAAVYSDDSDTAYNSGLYENIYHNEFESVVNDWLFDSARKEGDTTVVQGDDAYYFLYFSGVSGNYRDYLVDQALRTNDYSSWYDTAIADVTATQQDFGMSHVYRTLNIPSSSSDS